MSAEKVDRDDPTQTWSDFVAYNSGDFARPYLNNKRPKVSSRYIEATDEWEAYVSSRNGFVRVAPSLNPTSY